MPRPEFVKQESLPTSFALLSIAGNSAIQLAHFDLKVPVALRQIFEPLHSHREIPDQSLFELTFHGKPWSNPKSAGSESIFITILSVILSHGYHLITPIDYGREEDGKLAIVFARSHQPFDVTAATRSRQAPFAVSFVDKSTLRVISPPLHSTPAILQALRAAWPRGISAENKIAINCYEFKLKGYSSVHLTQLFHASTDFPIQSSEKTPLRVIL